MNKTISYKANLKALKDHIDLYIEKLHWARNPETYAYMVGIVNAYNRVARGLQDEITEIPDTPELWIEQMNDQIKRQQDAEKEKIIVPDKPKIILP
jgi:hypothetical protein